MPILKHTVFDPIGEKHVVSSILIATLFHRSAVILYLIYMVWAIAAFFVGLPTAHFFDAPEFQSIFSLIAVIPAALAAIGALYFPRLARLEMLAASGLVVMVIWFLAQEVVGISHGDIRQIPNFLLNSAHLVIPTTRVIFVFRALLKQAKLKEQYHDPG